MDAGGFVLGSYAVGSGVPPLPGAASASLRRSPILFDVIKGFPKKHIPPCTRETTGVASSRMQGDW
jgi:hypothetical protein